MNYYGARKRESDGRYDYTCMNDRQIWPIGYCHAIRPFDREFVAQLWGGYSAGGSPEEIRKYADYLEERIAESKKNHDDDVAKFGKHYHIDGHATEEEACDCYRRYVLDHNVKMWMKPLDDDRRDLHRKCGHGVQGETSLTCGKWTMNLCEVGQWWNVFLCDEHMNQETIEKIYPKISWSTSSY